MTHDAINQPDVLVVSRVVLDDLHERDGRVIDGVLGGSGFWAAFGAALFTDEVALTCKVGPDFDSHRDALSLLGIRTDGLVRVDRPTSRTIVTYPQDESRHEVPMPDWAAHVAMRTVPHEFPASVARPRGFYVFRGWHPGFWEELIDIVESSGSPMLWEIPASICTPEDRPRVGEILRSTRILSINLEEATALCGPGPETELVERLHQLGAARVGLRLGSRGALYSDGVHVVRAGPPTSAQVVDVTGAGNSFSGALLAAYLGAPESPDQILAGAIAASITAIGQTGPPPDLTTARAVVQRHLAGITVHHESNDDVRSIL